LNPALDRLAGQIVRLVGRDDDLELGQHVPFDRDGLLGLDLAQFGGDLVLALVDLIGQREVGRGDAVVALRRADVNGSARYVCREDAGKGWGVPDRVKVLRLAARDHLM
jgi:hypothetical protein